MRNFRKLLNAAGAVLVSLALVCGTCITASADTPTTAHLDLSKSGSSSISVTLKDHDDDIALGGELALYYVASLDLDDGSMVYYLTDAFKDCGLDPNTMTESSETVVKSAEDLRTYTQEQEMVGVVQSNVTGTVTFSDLELGLYLIVQTVASDGYESAAPFIVSVPLESDEGWIYDVDATPKLGVLWETTPPPEKTPETPETPTTGTLAQTGQLNWPIPLLCAAGAAFVLFGIVLMAVDGRRKRTNAA